MYFYEDRKKIPTGIKSKNVNLPSAWSNSLLLKQLWIFLMNHSNSLVILWESLSNKSLGIKWRYGTREVLRHKIIKRLSNKIKTHKLHLISHIKSDLHFSDMLYLLHIMCGYQCDKAVTKNDDPVK